MAWRNSLAGPPVRTADFALLGLRALSPTGLLTAMFAAHQCVLVSCHFSRSGGGPVRFCSFSTGPFHGSSVCLVLFQSVASRGSSLGACLLILVLLSITNTSADSRFQAGGNESVLANLNLGSVALEFRYASDRLNALHSTPW
jgi:hypothetical protein